MTDDATPSKAVRVTLFEDRAEVTRVARVALAGGDVWVALSGISPFVDERSVQARVPAAPGVKVIAARARRRAFLQRALGREQIDALEAEARAAERRVHDEQQALERAVQSEERAKGLRDAWIAAVSAVPRRTRDVAVLASWRESLRALEASTLEALGRAAAAREGILRGNDELARTRARYAEGTKEKPQREAWIEVELQSDEPVSEVDVEVTYRVPCALFRPEHLARLLLPVPAQGQTAPVEIVTTATAWQRTGEAWDDIEVRFSTARPARAAGPPLLSDDVIASRRKTDEERRRIEVSLREQTVQVAGLERGIRAVDEMPGVDDGGEPIVLAPAGKVSIASDGQPFRVEVQRTTVSAKIERVVFPEVARVSHLRATATLAKGGPLLAGPLRVARGQSLVGRAKLDFVGKGEPFELGLGVDDGVRVRREVTEERDTTVVMGTQKIKRKVAVYLSNLSNEPRRVLLTERVPVSELEDVTVTLADAGGFALDAKDGFLTREVDLGPHETSELGFGYEIRAGSKVVLPI